MARMIGKSQWHPPCRLGCCVGTKSKATAVREETALWKRDAELELAEETHELTPVDGYCCISCKEEYGGYLGTPDDLQNVEGVTYYGTQQSNL